MDILKDRFELSLKYNLVENEEGGWRFTQKCFDNYDINTYLRYLKGSLEKPLRITKQEKFDSGPKGYTGPTGEKKLTPQQEVRSPEYQRALDDIFNL